MAKYKADKVFRCTRVWDSGGKWTYTFTRSVRNGFNGVDLEEEMTIVSADGNLWSVGDSQLFSIAAK